jgi:peptidoglycan/LPS O-acetylase OafA/YrhL
MHKSYIGGIDGLRALAVLSVMFYHLDFKTLGGGFTGVDIFFVISGFVVSYSLSRHQQETFGKFVLFFYARRVLRILPALFVCLGVTALLTIMFVPSSWLSNSTMKTGAAAIFGLSNFALVFDNNGYFSPRSEFNPFTHTWSLGVEEQFYLIFPGLFYVWHVSSFKGRPRPWLARHAVGLLAFASLLFCIYASTYLVDQAYYFIFSRFWELAAGVMLFQVIRNRRFQRGFLAGGYLPAGLGLVCIIAGLTLADKQAFPFPWALLPVLGTLLLISHIYLAEKEDWLVKVCNFSSVRWIGKLSYSLYLWHWPVYTLMRWTIGLDSFMLRILAVLTTFICGIVSFYGVENTFRRITWLQIKPWRSIAIGLIASICTLNFFEQVQQRSYLLAQSITSDSYDWYPYADNHGVKLDNLSTQPTYPQRQLFVFGDSHVGAYQAMLKGVELEERLPVISFWKAGCPVLQFTERKARTKCEGFINSSAKKILAQANKGDVVFIPSLRLHRFSQQGSLVNLDKVLEKNKKMAVSTIIDANLQAANVLIQQFSNAGINIIIEAPKPIFKAPPFRCSDWFNKMNEICAPGLTIPKSFFENYRAPVLEALEELTLTNNGVTIWDPLPFLCPSNQCSAIYHDKPLYFDGDHLSGYANRLLKPSFKQSLDDVWQAGIQTKSSTNKE